jgi:hypothetical protein
LNGSILIRSGGHGDGPSDAEHLHALHAKDGDVPVVPGTSLAGVLRMACRRIAGTLLDDSRADDLVDGLFGPRTIRGSATARAGRLWVGEARIEGGKRLRHTRVRIDPWTGGAADRLLFTSEPIYGGTLQMRLAWQRPPAKSDPKREGAERALLLLALRDLALGHIAVGGESATGRGRFGPAGRNGEFGRFDGQALVLTESGLASSERWANDLTALTSWEVS